MICERFYNFLFSDRWLTPVSQASTITVQSHDVVIYLDTFKWNCYQNCLVRANNTLVNFCTRKLTINIMVVFWRTEFKTLNTYSLPCHPAVAMLTGTNGMDLLQSAATILYTDCTTDSLKRFVDWHKSRCCVHGYDIILTLSKLYL
jgi:hypothetical protein